MKSFKEFTQSNNDSLNENRFVRKGLGLAFARQSKTYGDKSIQNFKNLQRLLSNPSKDINSKLDNIEKGFIEHAEGMINLRKQIGSVASMVNLAILMNERTNQQITKLSKKR
jgi:hypothetical protein